MQTPSEKRLAYGKRRSVRPRFTPAQARALLDYLDAQRATQALGTTLSYVRQYLWGAEDEAENAEPKGTK